MTDEVQRFDIDGVVQAGQRKKQEFTLAFRGAVTDPPLQCLLPDQPDAPTVQAALEALPTVRAGNVVVTKDADFGYVCTFVNELGGQDLPELQSDNTNMSGGTVVVSTVVDGVPPVDTSVPPVASIPLPCTLQQFENWLHGMHAFAAGRIHQVVVSSDGSALSLSRAEASR